MDIKQLRHFLAIYKYGSISKAAENLYISQQGLSCSLLRLESELTYRLLNRTANGMTLTEKGKALLPLAEKVVQEFDNLEEYTVQLSEERRTIRIGSTLGAIFSFVAPYWLDFKTLHPQYQIEVIEVGDHECDRLVESGEVELAFGTAPFDKRLFDCKPVYASQFCVLVHKSRAIKEIKTVNIDFLRDIPIMIMNESSKTNLIITNACNAKGFSPKIQYSAAEVIAIHRMVSMNAGIGVSVSSVAEALADQNVVIYPFEEPELSWEINMFKLRNKQLSPGVEMLADFITNGGLMHSED